MDQANILDQPSIYTELLAKSEQIGFDMPSDVYIGTLLKSLIASKLGGNFLELGTGIGLSLAWMLEGLDENSKITSVDNNLELVEIAEDFFQDENRLNLVHADGEEWLLNYQGPQFDLVFADAWPGKYSCLENVLALVKKGGFYVIDDMKYQSNWPAGHQELVDALIRTLEKHTDFTITKMDWSTGVIVAVKTK